MTSIKIAFRPLGEDAADLLEIELPVGSCGADLREAIVARIKKLGLKKWLPIDQIGVVDVRDDGSEYISQQIKNTHKIDEYVGRLLVISGTPSKEPQPKGSLSPHIKAISSAVSWLKALTGKMGVAFSPTDAAVRWSKMTSYEKYPKWKPAEPVFPATAKSTSSKLSFRKASRLWFDTKIPHDALETHVVQPAMSALIEAITKNPLDNANIIIKDTHKSPTLGTRKPDIVHYRAGKDVAHSVLNIVVVGDVKRARKEAVFTDDEKNHMMEFLEELAQLQPWRQQFIGYLTDLRSILFFRIIAKYDEERHSNLISQVFNSGPHDIHGEGGKYFAGMFLAELSTLGWELPTITASGQAVIVNELIGEGGSSLVFSATLNKKEVVAKLFREGAEHMLMQEYDNLALVKGLYPYVPRVVAKSDDNNALLLEPRAQHFAITTMQMTDEIANATTPFMTPTSKHLIHLLEVLEQIHSLGLVHRDIKMANFFPNPKAPKDQILLNDFGCAVAAYKSTRFMGSLRHAPDRVLDSCIHGKQYAPLFSDDYEMFVRCLYQRLHPHEFEAIQNQTDPFIIQGFWRPRMSFGIWKTLCDCAKQAGNLEAPDIQQTALIQMKNLIGLFVPASALPLSYTMTARRLDFFSDKDPLTAGERQPSTGKYAGIQRTAGRNTCYANSCIQMMFRLPEFRQVFDEAMASTENAALLSLKAIFGQLASNRTASSDTFMQLMFPGNLQQDAQEMLLKMWNQMGTDTKLKALCGLKFDHQFRCQRCKKVQFRTEDDFEIRVPLVSNSLEYCLKYEVNWHAIEDEVACEYCKTKDPHSFEEQYVFKHGLPSFVLVTLGRVIHMRCGNGVLSLKNTKYCEFPSQLALSRWLGAPHYQLRPGLSEPETKQASAIVEQIREAKDEATVLECDKQLREFLNPDSVYDLVGVFVHSGAGWESGHYFVYIKSFEDSQWYCFNDDRVTQATWEEVQQAFGGGSTTASELVFRRSGAALEEIINLKIE